jgi:hypothetical protein
MIGDPELLARYAKTREYRSSIGNKGRSHAPAQPGQSGRAGRRDGLELIAGGD